MLRNTFVSACVLCLCGAAACGQVLYDGTLGTVPDAQGWMYLTDPPAGAVSIRSWSAGATTLHTLGDISERAGFFGTFHPNKPTLDRTGDGYTIRLRVGMVQETHDDPPDNPNEYRAGFSLIALSSDLAGLELAFWNDEVWAYEYAAPTTFTKGESAAHGTSGIQQYDLAVQGSGYELWTGGTRILSGSLRNYSPFGEPYNIPSFLFFGDDTSDAGAESRIALVEHIDRAVPEPATLALLLAGAGALLRRRRG